MVGRSSSVDQSIFGVRRNGAVLREPRHAGRVENIGWVFGGNTSYAVSQWIVLSVFAKLGNTTMVGRYALALAVSTPVYLLFNLSLRTVQVTAGPLYGNARLFVQLRVITALTALAVTTIVSAFFDFDTAIIIFLTSLAKALDAFADIVFGVFQRQGKLKQNGISLLMNGLVTTVTAVVAMLLTGSQVLAVMGSVVASALASVAYPALAVRSLLSQPGAARHSALTSYSPSLRALCRLAVAALPVGAASGLVALTTNLPKYILPALRGQEELGVFAALSYVVLPAGIMFGALAQAELHSFATLSQSGDVQLLRRRVGSITAVAVSLSLPFIATCVWAGQPILRLVYGQVYASHSAVLTVVSLSIPFSAASYILDAAISAQRRYMSQLVTATIVFGLSGLAALALVPRWGILGAAATLVVSAASRAAIKGFVFLHDAPPGPASSERAAAAK